MQAECLYCCLKSRVTDRPFDSMSLDVTFFSGSSIILLHCQETGDPVQAEFLNVKAFHCGNVIEGSAE